MLLALALRRKQQGGLSPAIDHVQITVSNKNAPAVVETYKTVLAPLGIEEIMRFGGDGERCLVVGIGDKPNMAPFFWIKELPDDKLGPGIHLAFKADNRQQIDEFYAAALKAGFKSHGEPGLRPHYHENYYAAYVIDDYGNNIEAVFHDPVSA